MRNIDKLKTYLKQTAVQIRETRAKYKEAQQANLIRVANKELFHLLCLSEDYRHHHIAYCELRGKTRDQIEQPRDNNAPNEFKIKEIKNQYAWTPEEIAAYQERQKKRKEKK